MLMLIARASGKWKLIVFGKFRPYPIMSFVNLGGTGTFFCPDKNIKDQFFLSH